MCKPLEDVQNINEELSKFTNSSSWDRPMIVDDEEHSIQFRLYLENSSNAITPVLPTKEPKYYLNNESECDVPVKDESSPFFTTFSNPLFDCNDDFTSSDDESLSNKDVLMENFKIYSNAPFDDEEISSNKIYPHYFNAESNLIKSLPNRDTLFDSSPKFDYLEEFSVVNHQFISRPLENFHANTIIETLPTSPIAVEDSDSLREEIDIFTSMDDLMPPSIESDDYDSEGDIHFLEELHCNESIPLSKNKSSNFDHHDDPSFPRPPPKPPDVKIFFEPDSGVLTTKVVKGNSKHYVLMPNIFPTLPTFDSLYQVYDTLLPFSSKNEDKVFKPARIGVIGAWEGCVSDWEVIWCGEGRNADQTEELNLTNGVDTEVIVKDKGSGEKGGSTADQVSTARPEVSATTPSTPPTTTTIFGDEELIIAQTLIKMRSENAKEKGVAFRDVEEPPRLTRSATTLQPLPTIDPKDKELDRGQKERQKQEEATIAALTKEFDEIQARMDVDYELAIRKTHEEQEMYTIEERARLLAEYFKRRKK
nr:hypothetical protein [Tanacetum cinerariifolium]